MTFIEILQLTLVLVIAIILVTAYFVKPVHSHIIFKSPPALIRVNTPRKNWSDVRRTIKLPNGKDYVIPIEAKGHFVLILDWVLAYRNYGKTTHLIVPVGTKTDFASIPRFIHTLISPLSNSIYGAVLHDYLYRNPADPTAKKISRTEADALFYWGMRACGVYKLTAGLMYLAVFLFGWLSYHR